MRTNSMKPSAGRWAGLRAPWPAAMASAHPTGRGRAPRPCSRRSTPRWSRWSSGCLAFTRSPRPSWFSPSIACSAPSPASPSTSAQNARWAAAEQKSPPGCGRSIPSPFISPPAACGSTRSPACSSPPASASHSAFTRPPIPWPGWAGALSPGSPPCPTHPRSARCRFLLSSQPGNSQG